MISGAVEPRAVKTSTLFDFVWISHQGSTNLSDFVRSQEEGCSMPT